MTANCTQPAMPRPLQQRFFDHVPALDGLRGIAILLVILHNAAHFGEHPHGFFWIVAVIAAQGWVGVQLFFVLSGFLITSKLLATRHASNYYAVFFGRRVLRIFPLYYGALIVGLVIAPALTGKPPGGDASSVHEIWLWTFLFNWVHPWGTPAFGFPHFWSLAVEEQFYLLWPFVVHRLSDTKLARACLGLIIGTLVVRTIMAVIGAPDEMIYEFTICRMDALAAGALLATWLDYQDRPRLLLTTSSWHLPAALAIVTLGALFSRLYTRDTLFTQTIGYTFLAAFFALILLPCVIGTNRLNRIWRALLSARALRSVGKYSFAMYVFHFPIQWHLQKFLPLLEQRLAAWAGIVFVVIVGLLSYAGAYLSYHLFEKHFLRLKSSFTPRAPQAGTSAEVLRHA
ncbi:MAG TPA: acyltransferase [Steroidobacteraceae bacterium]|nr:acyltransferase [Steroidobacteraceae bacterium]